jgi:hypothetical protein
MIILLNYSVNLFDSYSYGGKFYTTMSELVNRDLASNLIYSPPLGVWRALTVMMYYVCICFK